MEKTEHFKRLKKESAGLNWLVKVWAVIKAERDWKVCIQMAPVSLVWGTVWMARPFNEMENTGESSKDMH